MNFRRILGIILFIIGIAMLGTSYYIQGRVQEGKGEVSSAQKKVDKADALFSLSPYTKDVGKGITDSAQKKIDEGQQQIVHYTEMAKGLKIGGIVLLVIGAITVAIPRQSRKRR